MKKTLTGIMLMLLLSSGWACTRSEDKPGGSSGGGGGDTPSTDVPDRDGCLVKGMVFGDGKPLPGVVVSDGRNVTATDSQGKYWLETTSGEDFVWVSVPSGYEVPVKNGWEPQFYRELDLTKLDRHEVQRFDFQLTSRPNDDFELMVFTDTHVRGVKPDQGPNTLIDSLLFLRNFIPTVKVWSQQNAASPRYGIVLGDMIQDWAVPTHGGLPEYKRALKGLDFPIFHIPGNHDYNGEYELVVQTDIEARPAKAYYRRWLGPTYYSLNIGKVHFVMLDGTQILGGGINQYKEHVTPRQIAWMQQDLAEVGPDMTLVICCHESLYRYDSKLGSCINNTAEVMSLTDAFPEVTILSGHWHVSDICHKTRGTQKIAQYIHTGVCGAFWRGPVCPDGAGSGYTSYSFRGKTFTRFQKAYDSTYDKQAIFYDTETDATSGKRILLVNVPAFEDGWTLKITENGVVKAQAVRQLDYDPGYINNFYTKYNYPQSTMTYQKTSHMFRYEPVSETATFVMTVTTPEGRFYTKTTKFK